MMYDLVAEYSRPKMDNEIVEFPLLISGSQMQALESAARVQGMTAGQMVRRLIQDFCEPCPVLRRVHALGEG